MTFRVRFGRKTFAFVHEDTVFNRYQIKILNVAKQIIRRAFYRENSIR